MLARGDEDPKARKRLVMAIYKRSPIGNKMLRGGKHVVMFTGPSATAFGVENYASVDLEDLGMDDLRRAARAVGVFGADVSRTARAARDSAEERELAIYIDNEEPLYRHKLRIVADVEKRLAKGTYDPMKARRLWLYLVDEGAKRYAKEFGTSWHAMFPKKAREAVAAHLERYERERIERGEYASDPGPRRHRRPGAPTFAAQARISRKIRVLVREGYPPKQAAAIAYRMEGVPPRAPKRETSLQHKARTRLARIRQRRAARSRRT